MTEAFPNAPDPFAVQRAIVIKERGTHVPSWYVPHEDTSVTIKLEGVEMIPQIQVGQIAPERRWAVRPDGNLLGQLEFETKYKQMWVEWYHVDGVPVPKGSRPENAPIPNVKQYIDAQVDPHNPYAKSLVPILGAKPKKVRKIEYFVDKNGERVEGERMAHLLNAYHDKGLRKALTANEIEEVERHLRSQGIQIERGNTSDLASQLEALTAMKDAGDITDDVYIKRVGMLTGTLSTKAVPVSVPVKDASSPAVSVEAQPEAPEAPKKKRIPPMWKTPCGLEIYAVQKRTHVRGCDNLGCKEVLADKYGE